MALFCTTHHTLTIESWNGNGVHVLDHDTQRVRLILRDKGEVYQFIAALIVAQQKPVLNETKLDPVTRDWDTPEEDEAWAHLQNHAHAEKHGNIHRNKAEFDLDDGGTGSTC